MEADKAWIGPYSQRNKVLVTPWLAILNVTLKYYFFLMALRPPKGHTYQFGNHWFSPNMVLLIMWGVGVRIESWAIHLNDVKFNVIDTNTCIYTLFVTSLGEVLISWMTWSTFRYIELIFVVFKYIISVICATQMETVCRSSISTCQNNACLRQGNEWMHEGESLIMLEMEVNGMSTL
jgi:hypothetical protein